MSENFPLAFRKQQIEAFCESALEASTFTGPNNQLFHDSHVEAIVEEVRAGEADLTAARVSIEQYIINELHKDPDNVVFMRMSDAFRPIFAEVISIEVKMYGAPKFIVSADTSNATAWRMDAAAETHISSVTLPQDVMAEAAKYHFTTVNPADYVLPEIVKDTSLDARREFFKALPADEDSTVDREHDWLDRFDREANYDLIDRALHMSNFHDQVTMGVIRDLRRYCTDAVDDGTRDEAMIKYENECPVHTVEIVPDEFIITAANASKRAFFTLLQITGEELDKFKEFVKNNTKWLREENDNFVDGCSDEVIFIETRDKLVDSLLSMYGKHPIFEYHMFGFKVVFKYLLDEHKEMLNHFYLCFNDLISFYDERNFHESSTKCNLLKDYISELEPQEVEPTAEEIKAANEKTANERANNSSSSVYID